MPEADLVPLLTAWQNFYVIVGSASAALTGLMFVVITLSSRNQRSRAPEAHAAFNTPNIAHFAAALFVAAVLSAPWPVLWSASIPVGLCGLAGTVYVIIVWRRLRSQTRYQPVLEDWLWHTAFPLVAYIALVVSSLVILANPLPALFVTGAAAVLFLFIGIHNAWDTVVYITLMFSQQENNDQDQSNTPT